jgi:hypothetical protein
MILAFFILRLGVLDGNLEQDVWGILAGLTLPFPPFIHEIFCERNFFVSRLEEGKF